MVTAGGAPTDILALMLLCAPPLARAAADGGAFGTWATDADGLPVGLERKPSLPLTA